MKYIKKFEATKQSKQEQIDLLRLTLMENPQYETHDFYLFIGRDDFREEEDGRYKKTLEIENMVKITPDENSLAAMSGLQMRAVAQQDSKLYHIWLPKEIEEEVSGKGSESIEPYLVDLINQYKQKGSDAQGRAVFNDVRQKTAGMTNNLNKYNM